MDIATRNDEIIEARNAGQSPQFLGRKYGISPSRVSQITSGRKKALLQIDRQIPRV